MIEAKSINVTILEHTIGSWIARVPLHLPAPDGGLLHQLARWAKAWAIWISHDNPVPAGIDVAATDYIGQHYALMLPIRHELAPETNETCFNLAVDAGLKIFNGTQPPQAIQDVLGAFAANANQFRRAADSAPRSEWQHYWDLYRGQLA